MTRHLDSEPETLANDAYRQLEEMIVTLALPPGAIISEVTLKDKLGLGRTPIREALQRLAGDRLVEIMPRRGVRVSEVHVEEQLLLLEVRRELERLLIRRAARRAGSTDRQAFMALANEMEIAAEDNDDLRFLRLDLEFNNAVAAVAANPFAASALAPLQALCRRFWYIHYRETADMPTAAGLHAAVLRSIAHGEPRLAAHASDRLLDWIESFTRSTVDL